VSVAWSEAGQRVVVGLWTGRIVVLRRSFVSSLSKLMSSGFEIVIDVVERLSIGLWYPASRLSGSPSADGAPGPGLSAAVSRGP